MSADTVTGAAILTISVKVEKPDFPKSRCPSCKTCLCLLVCVIRLLSDRMKCMIRSIRPANDPQDPPMAAPAADQ